MTHWLIKSKPGCYSIDELQRDKKTIWDGKRNYQVRNMMRDDMKVGDKVLFYHSSAGKETGVVGTAEIASPSYPDPSQFDKKSKHYDEKSDVNDPRWVSVDVGFVSKFSEKVSLQEIKLDPTLTDMILLRPGNRLSVFPIKKNHYDCIIKLAQK